MSKIQAGHAMARALKAEGVDAVFMLTGGHILPIIDGCVQEGIQVIDVRHEQAAAHAADAYARLTGRLGVALVTAGPGVTDALTEVANALYANSPVLLISGRHLTGEEHRGGLQEVDHPRLLEPVTRWQTTANDPIRLPEVVSIAARHAFAGRGGPVFIDVPWDVQAEMVEEKAVLWPERYRANRPAGVSPETLREVGSMLAAAERPVVFGGTGLRWSRLPGYTEAFDEFVSGYGAPVFLNSLARGSLPHDHKLLGNRARSSAMKQADLILALGVDWDFRTGSPTRSSEDWTAQVFKEETAKQAAVFEAAQSTASPVHPERFAREVADFFGDDATVCADGGDIVSTTAKWLKTSRPGGLLDPGPFGCLGVGAPFAIAARVAEPERRVGIVYGDGGFGFNGMEYDSLIRHELPVVGVVGNDGAWNNIKVLQRMLYPERVVAADLGIRPYEKLVGGLGGYGEFVSDPAELRPALERAEDSGVPALINVHIAEQLRMSSVYGA